MKRPSKSTILTLAALYAVTWIGAAIVYPRDMADRANEEYARAQAAQRGNAQSIRDGRSAPAAFPDGPKTAFRWCVPIAPAILLVSSDYHIGPLWGHGGIRLVFFYGIGTVETGPLFGWIS